MIRRSSIEMPNLQVEIFESGMTSKMKSIVWISNSRVDSCFNKKSVYFRFKVSKIILFN